MPKTISVRNKGWGVEKHLPFFSHLFFHLSSLLVLLSSQLCLSRTMTMTKITRSAQLSVRTALTCSIPLFCELLASRNKNCQCVSCASLRDTWNEVGPYLLLEVVRCVTHAKSVVRALFAVLLVLLVFSLDFISLFFVFLLFFCFLFLLPFISLALSLHLFLFLSCQWTQQAKSDAFTLCVRTGNEMKASSAPQCPHKISDLIELT